LGRDGKASAHVGQADFVAELDGVRGDAVLAVPLARGAELDAGAGSRCLSRRRYSRVGRHRFG
jgi:hypothetical protein